MVLYLLLLLLTVYDDVWNVNCAEDKCKNTYMRTVGSKIRALKFSLILHKVCLYSFKQILESFGEFYKECRIYIKSSKIIFSLKK